MENKKTYIAWAIRILVSVLFIISAIAKMYPSPYFAISTFEVKQLYSLGFSEHFAPYFSRTLIGIEMALGLLLLQNNWLRKFVVPVTILMLVVFIFHLTYVTLTAGNAGSCGCFGELLPMTPVEAILKNIVAVGLLVYLMFLLPKTTSNGNFWVLTTVLFASILGIFMLAPIRPPESNFTVSSVNDVVPMAPIDSVYVGKKAPISDTIKKNVPNVKKDSIKKTVVENLNEPKKIKSGTAKFFTNIDNGKQVLCYFVPGCDHCRAAAKELTEMKKRDKNFPPISILFMNEEADLIPDFFKEAGAAYPYKIIEIIPFWNILGKNRNTPGVKYLWNGNEYIYYDGIEGNKFNAEAFETLVKKPFSELKK